MTITPDTIVDWPDHNMRHMTFRRAERLIRSALQTNGPISISLLPSRDGEPPTIIEAWPSKS